MSRITKRQKEIFDKHLEAAKNKAFDHPATEPLINKDRVTSLLNQGETIESFWNYCWNEASITSQLMASPDIFGYYSGAGLQAARNLAKNVLERLGIK